MAKQENNSEKKPLIFKKTRAGIQLTKTEVKYIKKERKKLRKLLKKKGLKRKEDFEQTASSLGLYFDDKRRFGLLFWWFKKNGLWALLASLIALLTVMYLFSTITEMKGHFTINMSSSMFKNGFVLSEDSEFGNPSANLFLEQIHVLNPTSFGSLPTDLDEHEGIYSDATFFAYTFYLKNDGEDTFDYNYLLEISSETKDLSSATWVMIFEDDRMRFFAEPNTLTGETEVIPGRSVSNMGYKNPHLMSRSKEKTQFELVGSRGDLNYYRIVPIDFLSDLEIDRDTKYGFKPGDVHKYTVVLWLEGDDPDCTDERIDGHLGLEFKFQLVEEVEIESGGNVWEDITIIFDDIISRFKFWE